MQVQATVDAAMLKSKSVSEFLAGGDSSSEYEIEEPFNGGGAASAKTESWETDGSTSGADNDGDEDMTQTSDSDDAGGE
jgi:hypothetical protein